MQLDPQMKIFGAVGKFHLANHVDGCFSKWSLNFMKRAGHINGEIMETLWSGLNKVLGAARSMSKAHRQEILDDYMRDANKSSMILFAYYFNILVPTLLTKLKRSQVGLDSMQPAFEQLTNTCLQRKLPVESWRSAKRLAMEERGEKLRILDINHGKAPKIGRAHV